MYGYATYADECDAKHNIVWYTDMGWAGNLSKMSDNDVANGVLAAYLLLHKQTLDSAVAHNSDTSSVEPLLLDGYTRLFRFGVQYGVMNGVPNRDTMRALLCSDDESTREKIDMLTRKVVLSFCGPDGLVRFASSCQRRGLRMPSSQEFESYLLADAARRSVETWGSGALSLDDVMEDGFKYMYDAERLRHETKGLVSRECLDEVGMRVFGEYGFAEYDAMRKNEIERTRPIYEPIKRGPNRILMLDKAFAAMQVANNKSKEGAGLGE